VNTYTSTPVIHGEMRPSVDQK